MSYVKKPKEPKIDIGNEKEEAAPPEFDSVAVGIIKGEGKRRLVVKIPFNTTTMETGSVQVVDDLEDNQIAQGVFKLEVLKNGLFT